MSTMTFDSRFARTAGPRAAASTPAVRLTRRGKVTLFVAALVALLALAISMGSTTAATRDGGVLPDTTSVTVQPGQTLWQIAAEANPGGDVRQTVSDIMKLNALDSAAGLQMGRKLAVPVYAG